VRKKICSKRATAAKWPPQRKTQKEVKISKPEMVRMSIRSESMWKAANSLKARGTIRKSQSMVELRYVG
jgi:hypothetical protein